MPTALALAALALSVGAVASWAAVTQPLVNPPGRSNGGHAASPEGLAADVLHLTTGFGPRDAGHPANLDGVAAYLRASMSEAGGTIEDQPFTVDGREYRNVIARFGPPTRERIVVGAHYDVAGPFPGADDNASGVAGLLELARALGGTELPLQVELVAFTLEEPPYFRSPHMGSAVHAASLRSAGVEVRAMLALEMIGYFTDERDSQSFPLPLLRAFYPSRGNFITVVGGFGQGRLVRRVKSAMRGATPLPVHSINAPRAIPGVDFSDHASFWDAGYENAVMITDTAFYRNPRYHTPADTADTLDYERMAQVVQGVLAAITFLAAG